MTSRRRLLGIGAGLMALPGCGFHPLYMPSGSGGSGIGAELASIYVPVLVNRDGQLMRQGLQRRLEGSSTGVAKKYELIAPPALLGETVGIQRDTSVTRTRLIGNAAWTLRKLDVARTVIATGQARVVDGYNVIDQQYFALDLENEAATRRVVESLADQVVQQVAIFLRRQAASAAPAAPVAAPPPLRQAPQLDLPGPVPGSFD